MDNIITKAVVIKAVDYQENDKMLLLFSADLGKFSAHIKGVRKPNAKLKFAGQPFCFGEFTLTQKNGRYSVINCTEIESFFALRQNIDTYYSGCTILEFASVVAQENEPNPALFLWTLKALNNLLNNPNSKLILTKFLLTGLKIAGFGISFDECNVCGTKSCSKLFLDLEQGGAVCTVCKSNDSIEMTPVMLNCFKQIDATSVEKLCILRIDIFLSGCLANLSIYIQHLLKKLNSIQYLY